MTDSLSAIKLQHSNDLHTWESAAQPDNRLTVNALTNPEKAFQTNPQGSETVKQSFNNKSLETSTFGQILPQLSR